jgi:hypothetical protein
MQTPTSTGCLTPLNEPNNNKYMILSQNRFEKVIDRKKRISSDAKYLNLLSKPPKF